MPRLVNNLPKYSLHKASGHAKVKHLGKVTYLGKFGTPESRAAYAKFVNSLSDHDATAGDTSTPARLPQLLPGEPIKVKEIVLRFYLRAKTHYVHPDDRTPTSELCVVHSALQPLAKEFGEYLANDFGPKRLKELQQTLVKRGWSRRYINRMKNIVCRAFKWAASEELIDPRIPMALRSVDALKKGRTPATEYEPIGPVSDEDIVKTLPELSPMIQDMVRIHRLTGMRPGELLAMTRQTIDTSDPECWAYTPGRHKTQHHGKGRIVFIGPKCQAILTPWMMKAGDGRIFSVTRDGYRRAVTRACKRAGVAEWAPNQLRHSLATEVRSKFGLETAQVLLGHSNADVTQVYAERDLAKARAAARRIG
jgi:integrase